MSDLDYGKYVLVLSLVLPTYFLFALGIPEREVRQVSATTADRPRAIATMLGNTITAVVASICLVGLVGLFVLAAESIGLIGRIDVAIVLFAIAYFIANGVIYASSQVILALGRDELAAFFFYPAANIAVSLVLTVSLLFGSLRFETAAFLASISAGLVAVAAIALTIRSTPVRPHFSLRAFQASLKHGARFAAARSLYSIGSSIPSFVAAAYLGLEATGEMGTAARLAAAVAAALAAVRFSTRPRMAAAAGAGDASTVVQMTRRAALLTFGFSVACLAVVLIAGRFLISLLFGSDLAGIHAVVVILLAGVLAEAFIGPSDEALKMAGDEGSVIVVFAATATVGVVACLIAVQWGVHGLAVAQVIASIVASLSLAMVFRKRFQAWPYPRWQTSRSTPGA